MRLTPTEWQLLRTFVTHADRTLTHQQIFDAVWAKSYGNAQQYLRVHLTNLRRKIEREPAAPRLNITEGRPLGFALALAGTVVIDYFFQPPYGLLGVGKPLDWVVLLAFCSTAFVTSALLAGARAQAEAAEARTSEIETLSRLGTETLRHTSVEEALAHIVALAQRAAQADACGIVSHDPPLQVSSAPLAANAGATILSPPLIDDRVATEALRSGRPAYADAYRGVSVYTDADLGAPRVGVLRTSQLAIPLRAGERTIGVFVVRGTPIMSLDGPRRRLLAALTYYATLGLERMRLVEEAAASRAQEASERAKNEIFAAVSHDLRTPLTTIQLLAQNGADRGDLASLAIAEQVTYGPREGGGSLFVLRLPAADAADIARLDVV